MKSYMVFGWSDSMKSDEPADEFFGIAPQAMLPHGENGLSESVEEVSLHRNLLQGKTHNMIVFRAVWPAAIAGKRLLAYMEVSS